MAMYQDSADSGGRFELQPTSARARIVAYGKGFAPSEILECQVRGEQPLEGIVLRLREGCRVEGRVLDERGDPVSEAFVHTDQSPYGLPSTQTAIDGTFMLEDLPAGVVQLRAYHPEEPLRASTTVSLAPGQTIVADLRLETAEPR